MQAIEAYRKTLPRRPESYEDFHKLWLRLWDWVHKYESRSYDQVKEYLEAKTGQSMDVVSRTIAKKLDLQGDDRTWDMAIMYRPDLCDLVKKFIRPPKKKKKVKKRVKGYLCHLRQGVR